MVKMPLLLHRCHMIQDTVNQFRNPGMQTLRVGHSLMERLLLKKHHRPETSKDRSDHAKIQTPMRKGEEKSESINETRDRTLR